MNRAYSLLNIKELDEDLRMIVGIASTPSVDRMDDIVEPKGAEFKLPIPLLWQHDSRQPIGHVTHAKITKDGIEIRAKLARMDEPGKLKDRLDEAWQSIRSGLVGALSIGFKAVETARIEGTFGLRYIKWLWLELSAVTIPANGDCSITAIKSLDRALLAASGHKQHTVARLIPPGASGPQKTKRPEEGKEMAKTIAEQISAFEATRQSKAARMTEIMGAASDDGSTLDQEQSEEYDALEADVKSVDAHLTRLRALESSNKASAKPVNGASQEDGIVSRGGGEPRVQIMRHKLEKGTAFVRYVAALANARGNRLEAAEWAKRWKDTTPEVEMILRAPVAAGTTTDATWAEPLVQYQNMAAEFIELLRPATIIGRIAGFRRVPFKVKVPRQTAGATVNWVGEGRVKPVSSLAFDSVTMDFTKIAGIIPLTEELVRFSSPSAEALVRADLIASIAQFMDREFVDPTKAEAVGVSPASITYGVTPATASGTTAAAFRADAKTMFGSFLTANMSVGGGVWIMTEAQALSLMLMQNSLGQPVHPNMAITGGTLLGYPVITTQNLPATGGSPTDGYPIIFLLAGEIMLADDGDVSIDMSREASLQMETAPDSPATASTSLISLWQHNMVAIKAERFINWKKRRAEAVAFIQNAKYAE